MMENMNIDGTLSGRLPSNAPYIYCGTPRRSADITEALRFYNMMEEKYFDVASGEAVKLDSTFDVGPEWDCKENCPMKDPRKCHFRPGYEESLAFCCDSCFDAEFCLLTHGGMDGEIKLYQDEYVDVQGERSYSIQVEEDEVQPNGLRDAALVDMTRAQVIDFALGLLKAVGIKDVSVTL